MNITGKLVKVLSRDVIKRKDGTTVTDRNGRTMEKMEFLIQLPSSNKEKFLKLETIQTPLMTFIQDTKSGTELDITLLVESREWQGKWFTSATAINAEANGQVDRGIGVSANDNPFTPSEDDLPF